MKNAALLRIMIHVNTDYGHLMTRSQILYSQKSSQSQIENPVKCMKILAFCRKIDFVMQNHGLGHRLRTPNEGINQKNLKIWANVADKICLGRTYQKIWDWELIFGRAVKVNR